MLHFISKSNINIYTIQYWRSEQFHIWAVWKYWVSFFFHTCFFSYFSNTSVEVQLISFLFYLLSIGENVNLQETNLYLCYCCLLSTVLPAVEPKTKDLCTLTERWCLSDGLLSVDQETELSVFSVALLPVFFYT